MVKLDISKLCFLAKHKGSGKTFEPIFRYDPVAGRINNGRKVYVTDKEGGRYFLNEEIELTIFIPVEQKLNGAEAVFGFMGWLTSRRAVSGPFSSAHDASQAAELADEFCKVNRLRIGDEGWYKLLVHPKGPRGISADAAHDMGKEGA